ncbi:hypothetical protein HAX54_037452 [Datura stramonium]|uniref:Uncharacterized protein n=1 Tax=Datura stramonium TaxID=4076 RepID=A0ABS8VM90_DATST|nr:hypothetical protein [Datura stramonium]
MLNSAPTTHIVPLTLPQVEGLPPGAETGPVVPDPLSGELEERWATWLNKFEAGTVIYSSFGSETFLNDDQIKELTLGFSSVIEALVNDCQVVMLPQKSDQLLNAKLVSGDMKAGVEVNRGYEDGYFGKGDIKEALDRVMMEVDK